MLLHNSEPVRLRKFFDRDDVGSFGAELLLELLAAQTLAAVFSLGELF